MDIGWKSLAVGITWLSGIATIVLAFLDRRPGEPVDLFFIPKGARLANQVLTALWAAFFLSMMLAQLAILPDQAINIAGIAAILGTSLLTIFFRFQRRIKNPDPGARDNRISQ